MIASRCSSIVLALCAALLTPTTAAVATAPALASSETFQPTGQHPGTIHVPAYWSCAYNAAGTLSHIVPVDMTTVTMSPYWHQAAHGGWPNQYVATFEYHQVRVASGWRLRYKTEYLKKVRFGRAVSALTGAPHHTSTVHSYQGITASRIKLRFVWFQPRADSKTVPTGSAEGVVTSYGSVIPNFGVRSTCPNDQPVSPTQSQNCFLDTNSGPAAVRSPRTDQNLVFTFRTCPAPPGYDATINVTVSDSFANAVANQVVRYIVSGRNSDTGAVLSNAAGVASFAYPVLRAGRDRIQFYIDYNDDGTQEDGDTGVTISMLNPKN